MLGMTSLFCFLAVSGKFGEAPIPAEFEEGRKVFHRKKGIDRTEKDARIVIGKWFDGDRVQIVEEAVFLTPGLLSRWIGYQDASGMPKEVTDNRWKQCSNQFSDKNLALIRLARLGTVDPHDGDVENYAAIEALDSVQFEMKAVGKEWQKVSFKMVQDIQDRQPADVLKETWDQVLAKFTAWPGTPTANDLVSEIRWGRNRRVSMLAEVPTMDPGSKCQLKIIEKDRTRVIPFTYPKS